MINLTNSDRKVLESVVNINKPEWAGHKAHAAALLKGVDLTGGMVDIDLQIGEMRRQLLVFKGANY